MALSEKIVGTHYRHPDYYLVEREKVREYANAVQNTDALFFDEDAAAELLRYQGNLVVQVVPYNGTPAVVNALRGGQVDAAVEILGPVKPQITAKALRALAVMGAQVPSDLPGTSLVSSQPGLSSFNVASWNALAAPALTPAPVLQRLNDEVRKALAQPDVQKRLSDLNVYPRASSPAQLAKLLDSEIVRWSDIIVRAGVPRQ